MLFNILRGTGLAGLAGILRIRKLTQAATIVRPLLDVTRGEVLDYLQSLGQPYRDDSSNRQDNYTRNRIRLQLLPLLERDFNPRVARPCCGWRESAAKRTSSWTRKSASVRSRSCGRFPAASRFKPMPSRTDYSAATC